MKDVKDIWKFFENLNEYVYAVDVENYEIVYMNKKARAAYGIESVENIKTKKCYEVFQKISIPCGTCNNGELSLEKFIECSYYNPVIDKHMLLKNTLIEDTANKRKYRVEIAVDVTEQKIKDKKIQKYRNMEGMVNEGLRIALKALTPENSIPVVLEYLGRSLNGERTYIFEKNAAGGDDNTYEWTAQGISAEKDLLQDLPPEVCADWYRNFSEGKNIVFRDIEDVRRVNPKQYEVLKRQNIRSLAVVPLYDDEKAIGFYGVDNPPLPSLEYASDMLQIMAHFIVSCLRRRNLMRELEDMGCRDAMTRLGNRFAMEKYIENINTSQSIGVVYCDITGLKRVNDTFGHQAGDRLILNASSCLKKAFGAYGVFRIGGDELLALCAGIRKEEHKEGIRLLKEYMKEKDVNMAVGEMWLEKADRELDVLLRESEMRMYEEKAAYYKQSGIERRR